MNEKCKLTCTSNGITMDADVMSFSEGNFLTVAIAEMKVSMNFNGKLFFEIADWII
jgi:hypothetical protein